jgi:hypothetical protein
MVNDDKIKIIKVIRDRTSQTETLKVNNCIFETADKFKYLESTVNGGNNVRNEISHRILLGNKCYFNLINMLKSQNISRKTMCKFYNMFIYSVITHRV